MEEHSHPTTGAGAGAGAFIGATSGACACAARTTAYKEPRGSHDKSATTETRRTCAVDRRVVAPTAVPAVEGVSPAAPWGYCLSDVLRRGLRLYGTLCVSTSPAWVAAMKSTACDFVFIDTEHIPIGRETLAWMCGAYGASGIAPIVRVPVVDQALVCMCLDGGAAGVVAPYMETVEQVKEMVGATKLRPLKGAKLQAALDCLCSSGTTGLDEATEAVLWRKNYNTACLVNIESEAGIANLEAMLSVPGVDAVLIGPHDLSAQLGIEQQYEHPKFQAAVSQIIRTAVAHGVGVGVHYSMDRALEFQEKWAHEGANLIVHSSDMVAFRNSIAADIAALRTALGDGTCPIGQSHETARRTPVKSSDLQV